MIILLGEIYVCINELFVPSCVYLLLNFIILFDNGIDGSQNWCFNVFLVVYILFVYQLYSKWWAKTVVNQNQVESKSFKATADNFICHF